MTDQPMVEIVCNEGHAREVVAAFAFAPTGFRGVTRWQQLRTKDPDDPAGTRALHVVDADGRRGTRPRAEAWLSRDAEGRPREHFEGRCAVCAHRRGVRVSTDDLWAILDRWAAAGQTEISLAQLRRLRGVS